VSTCDITVKEGQHVKKGEETGMFHFGGECMMVTIAPTSMQIPEHLTGSTQCCVFRKGVKVEGLPEPGHPYNHPVRAELGRVV
jgi:phosphatidylserine decarboxylase